MSITGSAPTRTATAGPSGRTAALVLVATVLVAMLALPVRTWFLQESRIADAKSQLAAAEAGLADLEQQKTLWQDPAYVEQQARLRLNYVKPGEVGIVVISPPAEQASPEGQPPTWHDSLWQTVESASGRGQTTLGEPIQVRPDAPR